MQTTIYQIKPFDAEIGATIKFSWSGEQVFKNRCIIKDNETDVIVYDNTISTFKMEHVIDLSKAALENGKRYNAYITVFDSKDVESDMQPIGQSFLCLKTPTFQFIGISDGQVLGSSTYNFQLEYLQDNGELLDSWSISIYDNNETLLQTSGLKYATDDLSHIFSGFKNKNEYKIRALGQTVNGMELDTGFINISVLYQAATVFSMVELENSPYLGAIHVHSNIISSEGYTVNSDPIYIDGKYIDLRNDEAVFDEGFLITDDFSIVLKAYHVNPNVPILTFWGQDNPNMYATLIYRIGKLGDSEMTSCMELKIVNEWTSCVIYSNKIPVVDIEDLVGICITRQGSYYGVQIENLGNKDSIIDTEEITGTSDLDSEDSTTESESAAQTTEEV